MTRQHRSFGCDSLHRDSSGRLLFPELGRLACPICKVRQTLLSLTGEHLRHQRSTRPQPLVAALGQHPAGYVTESRAQGSRVGRIHRYLRPVWPSVQGLDHQRHLSLSLAFGVDLQGQAIAPRCST
ncbi:uncharacterized protein LOC144101313 isoform X1 [Amblyomma americanum]